MLHHLPHNHEDNAPLLGFGGRFGGLYHQRREQSPDENLPDKRYANTKRNLSPTARLRLPPPTYEDNLRPRIPSPRAGVWSSYKISGKKRVCLQEIRSTDIQQGQSNEQSIPKMLAPTPGFLSEAHLRSEEYWRELTGYDIHKEGPFRWVESDFCHLLVGCCIITNACILSLHFSDHAYLVWVDHFVLAFSVFELSFLVARHRRGIPYKNHHEKLFIALDCLAVTICVVERWMIPIAQSVALDFGIGSNNVIRLLMRLIWLFRFVRLIRIIPALNELARGVIDALQGLFWVLCFMLLLMYALAILCTRLIGHYEFDIDDDDEREKVEEVQKMFANVQTSLFYLFETMSSWTLVPLIPLFELAPMTRLLFVFFYIYAGWTLLAVMTGVVSFHMIALRGQINREDDVREQEKREKAKEILVEIFEFTDTDHSGELNLVEFTSMLKNKEIISIIEEHTNVKVRDLEDLWNWLDDDNSDSVSYEEFTRGFQWLNETFKPKTLLRLQEKITKELKGLKRRFHELIMSVFDKITLCVQPPMRKMHAVTEQVQMLEVVCANLRDSIAKVESEAARRQEMRSGSRDEVPQGNTLAAVESRIGAQIDEVLARLDRFVPADGKAMKQFKKARETRRMSYGTGTFASRSRPENLETSEEHWQTTTTVQSAQSVESGVAELGIFASGRASCVATGSQGLFSMSLPTYSMYQAASNK